jgi:hypothetical protein
MYTHDIIHKYTTVFLLILKRDRDRDRRVQKRPHKNHRQCDSV